MEPIKLDCIYTPGRLNGMGEPDPKGSYVGIVCAQLGASDEPPQERTFSISEGMAYELTFDVLTALGSDAGELVERIRREVNAFEGADERTALEAADRIEHMHHALARIAEWAETADEKEAAAGLAQTARIARGAIRPNTPKE